MIDFPYRRLIGAAILLVICGILGFVTYQRAMVWWTASERVIQARAEYEVQLWERKTATIVRNDNTIYYLSVGAVLSLLGTVTAGTLVVTTGKHRATVRQASVFTAKIGRSEVPVEYSSLRELAPVYAGLTAAEQLYQSNTGQAEAIQYFKDFANITKSMAQRRIKSDTPSQIEAGHPAAMLTDGSAPSFASLLQSGEVGPGKPLILGYSGGLPELRDIRDLKSVAFAGWQGSGKTRSAAYLIGSSVLNCDARVFVVDPHKGHKESLSTQIEPLLKTQRVRIVNPFEVPALISLLNKTLDKRLSGQESSDQSILLVIDELAQMAKINYFDKLITFLERCTEETRKANITFFGCSPKWTARHFKGRADIRGCMNSCLVHKCKISQAKLLLEDKNDQKLVKQLQNPGEAVLMTDFGGTKLTKIPFCTRQDMEVVAQKISQHASVEIQGEPVEKFPVQDAQASTQKDENRNGQNETETLVEQEETSETPFLYEVSELRKKTVALVETEQETWGKLEEKTGVNKGQIYKFAKYNNTPSDTLHRALSEYIKSLETPEETNRNADENEEHLSTDLIETPQKQRA